MTARFGLDEGGEEEKVSDEELQRRATTSPPTSDNDSWSPASDNEADEAGDDEDGVAAEAAIQKAFGGLRGGRREKGKSPPRNNRLSAISESYDVGNKGYLDRFERSLRNMSDLSGQIPVGALKAMKRSQHMMARNVKLLSVLVAFLVVGVGAMGAALGVSLKKGQASTETVITKENAQTKQFIDDVMTTSVYTDENGAAHLADKNTGGDLSVRGTGDAFRASYRVAPDGRRLQCLPLVEVARMVDDMSEGVRASLSLEDEEGLESDVLSLAGDYHDGRTKLTFAGGKVAIVMDSDACNAAALLPPKPAEGGLDITEALEAAARGEHGEKVQEGTDGEDEEGGVFDRNLLRRSALPPKARAASKPGVLATKNVPRASRQEVLARNRKLFTLVRSAIREGRNLSVDHRDRGPEVEIELPAVETVPSLQPRPETLPDGDPKDEEKGPQSPQEADPEVPGGGVGPMTMSSSSESVCLASVYVPTAFKVKLFDNGASYSGTNTGLRFYLVKNSEYSEGKYVDDVYYQSIYYNNAGNWDIWSHGNPDTEFHFNICPYQEDLWAKNDGNFDAEDISVVVCALGTNGFYFDQMKLYKWNSGWWKKRTFGAKNSKGFCLSKDPDNADNNYGSGSCDWNAVECIRFRGNGSWQVNVPKPDALNCDNSWQPCGKCYGFYGECGWQVN